MLPTLAEHTLRLALPVWDRLVVPLLTVLIYGFLGPAVYLIILAIGVDLAWPGGTHLREVVRRRGHARAGSGLSSDPSDVSAESPPLASAAAPSGDMSADADAADQAPSADPTSHIRRAVGGLVALAVLSTVITIWLADYPAEIQAPPLSTAFATLHREIFFFLVLVIGFVAGFLWTTGMRTARTTRAALTVLALSMSLSSVLLFYYIVESGLRDLLLVVALGIFAGELYVAGQHPTLMSEGLFAEVLRPLTAEDTLPTGDDGTVPGAEAQEDAEEWRAQTPTHSFVTADAPPAADDADAPESRPPTPSAGPPPGMTNG